MPVQSFHHEIVDNQIRPDFTTAAVQPGRVIHHLLVAAQVFTLNSAQSGHISPVSYTYM